MNKKINRKLAKEFGLLPLPLTEVLSDVRKLEYSNIKQSYLRVNRALRKTKSAISHFQKTLKKIKEEIDAKPVNTRIGRHLVNKGYGKALPKKSKSKLTIKTKVK